MSRKMADVHPVAPDGMSDDSTPGDDTKSVDGQRTCTVCGNPVKGHLGLLWKVEMRLWSCGTSDHTSGVSRRAGAYLGRTFEGFPVCQLLI